MLTWIRHSIAMRIPALGLALGLSLSAASCTPTDSEPPPPLSHAPTEVLPIAGSKDIGQDIQYTLSFENAAQHYITVRAVFPAKANSDVELRMAVWTPGSYLIREYARQIEGLRAVDSKGAALPFTKVSKNRWSFHTGSEAGLIVEYKLYCRELSVRTNFVDADSVILNGAPTFLTMTDDKVRAHTVTLQIPDGFKPAVSALDSDAPNTFHAKSFDELVDSPIIASRDLVIGSFEVNQVKHRLVHLGDSSQWDLQEALLDVEQLTRAEARFWGVLPYAHYDFLNVILGGGGGLEHLDSTLMLASPLGTKKSKDYRKWLGLVAHEFFHTWNVKRLRPKALGPFAYESENYTRSLWIAEGITSYYDDLLLRRAGLLDEKQYLERLGGQIRSLQTTEGRLVQTLSTASYDAWIKHYRRDENSANTSISYYTKGAVVAFLLDAEIRKGSGGKASLDDVMRTMYEKYAGETGYTPEQFRAVASEAAQTDLSEFFVSALDSTQELDYSRAIAYFGLQLDLPKEAAKPDDSEDESEEEPAGWIGAKLSGAKVTTVKRGTPAFSSGINVGDEILAVDGYRAHNLDSLLEKFSPDQRVILTISRRGKLREIPIKLGTKPEKAWGLEQKPNPTSEESMHYKRWIAEYTDL